MTGFDKAAAPGSPACSATSSPETRREPEAAAPGVLLAPKPPAWMTEDLFAQQIANVLSNCQRRFLRVSSSYNLYADMRPVVDIWIVVFVNSLVIVANGLVIRRILVDRLVCERNRNNNRSKVEAVDPSTQSIVLVSFRPRSRIWCERCDDSVDSPASAGQLGGRVPVI